jgi:hypothetical protein
LSGGDRGLARPQDFAVAVIERAGRRRLRLSAEQDNLQVRVLRNNELPSHGLKASHCRTVDLGGQFIFLTRTDYVRQSGILIFMDSKARYLDTLVTSRR